ncbi:MAG: YfcE family phosphodiesterase [Kineosporiaceae bacterium]
MTVPSPEAPVRLLIVSDTHVPARARDVPHAVWDAVDAADVVVHAGDWVSEALLDAVLERLATPHERRGGRPGRLLAVAGNNDGARLHERLPEVARATLGGVRLAVVHETGPTEGRERRCERTYGADTDVLVFGHSHIPWDSTTDSGLRLLNPGSPTDRRRQPALTYLTATAAEGTLHDVVLHRLAPGTR